MRTRALLIWLAFGLPLAGCVIGASYYLAP